MYLDNRFVSAETKLLRSVVPWMLEGRGVFETIRVDSGSVSLLDAHLDRLMRGLRAMKIKIPYTREFIERKIYQSLQKNALSDARIRLTVWEDQDSSRLSIVIQPLHLFSENRYRKGYQGIISKAYHQRTRYSHLKSIHYGKFKKALDEAHAQGADEAIIINHKKQIVEGSHTNLFFVKNNCLFTPAVYMGCLNGITRQMVINLARKMNLRYQKGIFHVRQLIDAEEAFLTNSLMNIMPLTFLNGKEIGKGQEGPISFSLRSKYRDFIS